MANKSSNQITKLDSDQAASGVESGGLVTSYVGRIAVAAAEATGDVLRFVRVPLARRVVSILEKHDAIAAGNMNLGIYRPGGGVIDADFYGGAYALTGAQGFQHRQGVGSAAEHAGKTLGEILEELGHDIVGLTAVDIAGTLTTDPTGAGSVAVEVQTV